MRVVSPLSSATSTRASRRSPVREAAPLAPVAPVPPSPSQGLSLVVTRNFCPGSKRFSLSSAARAPGRTWPWNHRQRSKALRVILPFARPDLSRPSERDGTRRLGASNLAHRREPLEPPTRAEHGEEAVLRKGRVLVPHSAAVRIGEAANHRLRLPNLARLASAASLSHHSVSLDETGLWEHEAFYGVDLVERLCLISMSGHTRTVYCVLYKAATSAHESDMCNTRDRLASWPALPRETMRIDATPVGIEASNRNRVADICRFPWPFGGRDRLTKLHSLDRRRLRGGHTAVLRAAQCPPSIESFCPASHAGLQLMHPGYQVHAAQVCPYPAPGAHVLAGLPTRQCFLIFPRIFFSSCGTCGLLLRSCPTIPSPRRPRAIKP